MAKQTFTTGQVLTSAQMTALQLNDYNQTVSAKVASYTLVAADVGTRVTMSNAGATTITVNTSLFTAGDTLFITNIGAGACTITAGTATVSTASSLVLAQYDSGRLYFTSTGVAIWEKYQGASGASAFVGCSLYKSATQSVANSTDTALTFDSEDFDTNAFHDTVTNNSRITIPTSYAGKYLVTAKIASAPVQAGGSYRNLSLYKNGSIVAYQQNYSVTPYALTVVENHTAISQTLSLSVGDYLQVYWYQESGVANTVNANSKETIFQVTYLGA